MIHAYMLTYLSVYLYGIIWVSPCRVIAKDDDAVPLETHLPVYIYMYIHNIIYMYIVYRYTGGRLSGLKFRVCVWVWVHHNSQSPLWETMRVAPYLKVIRVTPLLRAPAYRAPSEASSRRRCGHASRFLWKMGVGPFLKDIRKEGCSDGSPSQRRWTIVHFWKLACTPTVCCVTGPWCGVE